MVTYMNTNPTTGHQARNENTMNVATTTVRHARIAEAAKAHADFPQYHDGYWNDWSVGRIKRNLRSRGAQIASKGQIVLVNESSLTTADQPEVASGMRRAGYITAQLPDHYAGNTATSIKATDIEIIR